MVGGDGGGHESGNNDRMIMPATIKLRPRRRRRSEQAPSTLFLVGPLALPDDTSGVTSADVVVVPRPLPERVPPWLPRPPSPPVVISTPGTADLADAHGW